MSYTNETTHYGIPLPLGTDKTTPMDYNTSMQEVDTVLFGAKSDSDSALRKAQQVEEDLSQTDGNVTALAGRVTTLEGTSVTHGNAIQQNAQDIADVRADALDMIEAKDEGTAQVATVAVNKGEYFRYNDVLYLATQNIGVGTTIIPNTNCRATNVGTELKEINSDLKGATVLLTFASTTTWANACVAIQTAVRNSDVDFSKLRLRFYSSNEDNYALLEPVQYAFASTGTISFLGFVYISGNIGVRMIRTHATVVSESDGLTQWTSDNWTGTHIAVTDDIGGKIELIAV